MHFDWAISVPGLLGILALLASIVGAYFSLKFGIDKLDGKIEAEVRVLRHDLRALEHRQNLLDETLTLTKAKLELEIKQLDAELQQVQLYIRDHFVTKDHFNTISAGIEKRIDEHHANIDKKLDQLLNNKRPHG